MSDEWTLLLGKPGQNLGVTPTRVAQDSETCFRVVRKAELVTAQAELVRYREALAALTRIVSSMRSEIMAGEVADALDVAAIVLSGEETP